MRIFLDSDVIISSFISSSGASYYLLNNNLNALQLYISNFSITEIEVVTKRLNIQNKLKNLESRINIINLDTGIDNVRNLFKEYVYDVDDTHIVMSAKESKSKFLLTYNMKDYNIDLIKKDFNIIVLKPGMFIQYLRSINAVEIS
jgi:predicted nucleic acid-binding protein